MTCGVYQLTAPSGKTYIGSSMDCEKRYKGHKRRAEKGKHPNPHLTRAFLKYNDLTFRLLVICRPEDRIMYEQAAIDALKPEYNISKIAGVVEWTPELRKRRSDAANEYWSRPGTREAGAEHSRGRVASPETRAKRSAAARLQMSKPGATGQLIARNKAKAWTPEERYKAAGMRGKRHSSETRLQMSASAPKGPKSDATKANMRIAQKLRREQERAAKEPQS